MTLSPGDHDGVIVIPRAVAEEVVTQAEQLVNTENLVRKAILEGVHPVDAFNQVRTVLGGGLDAVAGQGRWSSPAPPEASG